MNERDWEIVSFMLDSVDQNNKIKRAVRYLNRKVGRMYGSIFALTIVSGILIITVAEQRDRIERLEKKIKNEEETAG